MRSGIAPKNRLINPRRRPIVITRVCFPLRPLLQSPRLLPLVPALALGALLFGAAGVAWGHSVLGHSAVSAS